MEKMRGIYEKNPQLGDAQQVAQQLVETQEKIDTTAAEIEEFKVSHLKGKDSKREGLALR